MHNFRVALLTFTVIALFAAARSGVGLGRAIPISIGAQNEAALLRCVGVGDSGSLDQVVNFEPYAAVNPGNPKNLAATWMVAGSNERYFIRVAASFDGGEKWARPQTLPITACSGGPLEFLDVATDPWIAFGLDGRLYVSAQAYFGKAGGHNGVQHIVVITSQDGGRTWDKLTSPIAGKGPRVKFDNSYIIADPIHPAAAYVLTSRYDVTDEMMKKLDPEQLTKGSDPVGLLKRLSSAEPVLGYRAVTAALARTTDGGKTWNPRQLITPYVTGAFADFPTMVIDQQTGRLYVFYSGGVTHGGIYMVMSGDQGVSWTDPLTVTEYTPVNNPILRPANTEELGVAEDMVHAAIDPHSGRLYVVFSDGRFSEAKYLQVGITSSSDGGRTWTKPARVNTRHDQPAWLPAIAVNRAGTVAVSYFDGRGPEYSQQSTQGLSLWRKTFLLTENAVLTNEKESLIDHFDLRGKPGEKGFLADYVAVLAIGNSFESVYPKIVSVRGASGRHKIDTRFHEVAAEIFFSH